MFLVCLLLKYIYNVCPLAIYNVMNYETNLIYLSDVLKRILVEEERCKIKEVLVKNQKDYNTVRNNARPDSSYVREAIELEKEKRTLPKPLPPRKPKPSCTTSVPSPKRSSSPTDEPPLKKQKSSSPTSIPRVESTVVGK